MVTNQMRCASLKGESFAEKNKEIHSKWKSKTI